MDQLFVELVGMPHSAPKIITIVAENFQILEHRAKFLKAVLAIPAVRKFPHLLKPISKKLVQFGPLHSDLDHMLRQDGDWIVDLYNDEVSPSSLSDVLSHNVADNLPSTVSTDKRSLVFVNDASKFLLEEQNNPLELLKFLRVIDDWKRCHRHFVIVLFQQSRPAALSNFLRNLIYISDAYVNTRLHGQTYMQSIWFQPTPTEKTLLPPLIETQYYTARIGKSESEFHFPCFQDVKCVSKNHNPDLSDRLADQDAPADEKVIPDKIFEMLVLDEDEEGSDSTANTLPYIRAQNPEQSRIFYYPDKEDDIDEDDPDEDLDI